MVIGWYGKEIHQMQVIWEVWERQIRSARSILNSLLKTHGSNLTEESLQTLGVEIEAIASSRSLTKEVMNDATSLAP